MRSARGMAAAKKTRRKMSREEVVSTIDHFLWDLTHTFENVKYTAKGPANQYSCDFRGENIRIIDEKDIAVVYIGKDKVSCLTTKLSRALILWSKGQYGVQQRVLADEKRAAEVRRREDLKRQSEKASLRLAERITSRKR